jgi:Kdo2-lipid IVA lauroyltransferase/acyltransferase
MLMKRIDEALYHIVRWWFHLVGALPSATREFLATVLGHAAFRMAARQRRITIDNLSRAFQKSMSPSQIETTARQVFVNMWRIVFEIGWSRRLPPHRFSQYFSLSGLTEYRRALDKGKGILLLIAHFGNWELLPIVAHTAHMPVRIVYRTMDAPFLDRFFRENRSRFGGVLISTRQAAMSKIYKALRRGCPVGLLMDQGADFDSGVFVDFFNRRAATNIGMAVLALKSEAPVVPLFLIRRPGGFQAVFGPELPLIKTGDRTKDIEENTQLYTNVIEAYARKFPDQWFWVHQRWKNLPFCPWPRTNPRISNRY